MKPTIGLIGAGNMGSAILKGINRKFKALVCEKGELRQIFLKEKFKITAQDLKTVVKKSQIVILAVKPQDFDRILEAVGRHITQKHLVISIAAGITTSCIEKKIGQSIRVVRAMPNLPAQVKEAMTALCKGRWAKDMDLTRAQEIFDCIGKTVLVEEHWMDAVTAVSGSGPAYVFLFVECLKKAAVSLGFEDRLSQELVLQTLRGSLKLLEESKEDPAVLRSNVTSKGGTTQAAMDVFEKNNLVKVFEDALKAAAKRAKELAVSE